MSKITFNWICPQCGHKNEEIMHSDPQAHFVSVTCESCEYELEDCPCEDPISKYLSSIGRRGGKKSKRTLTTEQARKMVEEREKKKKQKDAKA